MKTRTVARIFYGIMPGDDGTKALVHFFSNNDLVEKLWTKKLTEEKTHPERFLIVNGFSPVGSSLYILEDEE